MRNQQRVMRNLPRDAAQRRMLVSPERRIPHVKRANLLAAAMTAVLQIVFVAQVLAKSSPEVATVNPQENNPRLIQVGVNAANDAPREHLAAPAACDSIEQKYVNLGGEAGLLGQPLGHQIPIDDQVGGAYRDFRVSMFGMISTVVSRRESPRAQLPTCSHPRSDATVVDSSIYWSPVTCAHVVQGEIRDLWLRNGGPKGKLGYPVSDETSTPDHRGRMSVFEHGEIWWYPDKGASVRERTTLKVSGP